MLKTKGLSIQKLGEANPRQMRSNAKCVMDVLERIDRRLERQNQPLAKIGPSGASLTEMVLNHVHVPKLEQRNVLSLAMTEAE